MAILNKRKKTLLRYMRSYMIMLIIPIALTISACQIAYNAEIANGKERAIEVVEQAMSEFNSRMSEVRNIAQYLEANPRMLKVLTRSTGIYSYIEMYEEIRAYSLANQFIDEAMIYLKDEQMIISSNGLINRPELFYYYNYSNGQISYEAWEEACFSQVYTHKLIPTVLLKRNRETLYFASIHTIPQTAFADSARAVAIIYIKAEAIEKLFGSLLMGNCYLSLFSQNGELLLQSHPENAAAEIEPASCGVVYRDGVFYVTGGGSASALKYTVGIPDLIVTPRLPQIRAFFIAIATIIMIAGILVAFFLSVKSVKPLEYLIHLLTGDRRNGQGNPDYTDSLEYIEDSILDLINDNRALRKNVLLDHGDSESDEAFFYYPIDLENQLIKSIIAGNRDQVQKTLELLRVENFDKRKISRGMFVNFYRDLFATLIKCIDRAPAGIDSGKDILTEELQNIDTDGEPANIWNAIVGICDRLAGLPRHSHKKRSTELIHSICGFIKANYGNPDLSLYMMSEEFKLSEGYLSKFIKDNMGISLSSYIEEVRMNEAQRLLNESTCNINEIAAMVGYQSAHAFRRAFKRNFGILPSKQRSEAV